MQPERAFKSAINPAPGREPVWFYHGTQKAVHLLPDPRLDPRLADAGDVGDPRNPDGSIIPHVYVTPSDMTARIFALKRKDEMSIIGHIGEQPYLVLGDAAENRKTGYVYRINGNEYAPFTERLIHGKNTGQYYSHEHLDVSQGPHEVVQGVRGLMQTTSLQAYCMTDPRDAEPFITEWRQHGRGGEQSIGSFLETSVRQGRLNHLNRVYGLT